MTINLEISKIPMSQIFKQTGNKGTNIRVFARVRPFNDKQDPNHSCIASLNDKSISIKERDAKQPHNFTFDGIFQSDSTQSQIYESVGAEIVSSAFQGLNGTIFCYGQTSSGKTFTCVGPDYRDEVKAGILPRLIKETLIKIDQNPKNIESKMKISMVEIYNQKIKDLLDCSKIDLKIRSSKKQGIFLQNLTEKYILSEEEAFSYLNIGIQNRSVATTNMNSQSSRSHLVFIINLSTHDIYSGEAKQAKVILVDLAGSQKISKTGAEGKVLEEAKKINASLTALGKVINALSDGKSTHIPYRDSKLTRFLQESLGGNSLTNLIVNVSPSSYNQYETLTSFRFGQRAKSIKNQPIVNKCFTVDELLILLKKAEETIQRQNIIIKELSSKKRAGGYGALAVPSMITLHLLPDDESTQKSIDCQSQDFENYAQFQSQNSNNTLNSDQFLKLSLSKNKQYARGESQDCYSARKAKKSHTLTHFPSTQQNPYEMNRSEKPQGTIDKKLKTEQKICTAIKVPPLSNWQKIPSTIYEDVRENNQTPRNIDQPSAKRQKKMSLADVSNIQNNLDKIRQNLFELKLRYMEEKRQNSIKTMIIDRKNRIIENSKFTRQTHFLR